jgi:hypothetical protein
MIESFLEYFVDVKRILEEYFLTHGKKNHDVEEYFAICTWMNEIYGLKIKVDEKLDEQ